MENSLKSPPLSHRCSCSLICTEKGERTVLLWCGRYDLLGIKVYSPDALPDSAYELPDSLDALPAAPPL